MQCASVGHSEHSGRRRTVATIADLQHDCMTQRAGGSCFSLKARCRVSHNAFVHLLDCRCLQVPLVHQLLIRCVPVLCMELTVSGPEVSAYMQCGNTSPRLGLTSWIPLDLAEYVRRAREISSSSLRNRAYAGTLATRALQPAPAW